MSISFHHVFPVHHFGESATNSIAHFSALLDIVVPPINLEVASSSRLARNAEKRTLEPVQLRFLGLLERVKALQLELNRARELVALETAELLRFWLTSHILISDKQFADAMHANKTQSEQAIQLTS